MVDPLVREIGGSLDEKLPLDSGGIDFSEHSKASKAKKVINGPLVVTADPANDKKTIAPIDLTGAGSKTLVQGKAYRIISDGSFLMTQNNDSTIVVGDVYIPANTPVVISTDVFKLLAISGGTGTFIQAVEVR